MDPQSNVLVDGDEVFGFGSTESLAAPPPPRGARAARSVDYSDTAPLIDPDLEGDYDEGAVFDRSKHTRSSRGWDMYGHLLLDIGCQKIVSRDIVSRPFYYKQLYECLVVPHKHYNPNQASRVVTLLGARGLGKTSIAIDFLRASRERGDFSHCWFLDCSSSQMLRDAYIALGREESIGIAYDEEEFLDFQQFIDAVHTKLARGRWKKPWLLVYDGANHFRLDEKLEGLAGCGGSILITTYNRTFSIGPSIKVWHMVRLEDASNLAEEQRAVVEMIAKETGEKLPEKRRLPFQSPKVDILGSPHYALAKMLGGHPAMIRSVCKYISKNPITIQGYLDEKGPAIRRVLGSESLQGIGPGAQASSLWAAVDEEQERSQELLQFKFFRQIMSDTKTELSRDTKRFLEICACLGSCLIPAEWVYLWMDFAPDPDGDIGRTREQIYERIRREIFALDLVLEVGSRGEFIIHACYRYAIRDLDHEVRENKLAIQFLEFIAKKLSWSVTNNWRALQRWAVHAMAIQQKAADSPRLFPMKPSTKALFLEKMGEHYYNLGIYSEAQKCLREAYTIYKDLKDNKSRMRVANWRGKVFRHQSRQDKALTSFNHALEVFKGIPLEHSYEEVRAYRNIAMIYYHTNEEDKALEYIRKAYKAIRVLFPFELGGATPSQIDRVTFVLSSYALILMSYTKHHLESTTDEDKRADRQELMGCLCGVLHRDKPELAQCLSTRSVSLATRSFKKANLSFTWLLKNHAQILSSINPGEALKYVERAHNVHCTSFNLLRSNSKEEPSSPPPTHPDEAYFLHTKGHCLRKQGRLKEAREHYESALDIWSKGRKSVWDMPLKVEIVWALTSIGDTYRKQKKFAKAWRSYVNAHRLQARIHAKDKEVKDYRQLRYSMHKVPDEHRVLLEEERKFRWPSLPL